MDPALRSTVYENILTREYPSWTWAGRKDGRIVGRVCVDGLAAKDLWQGKQHCFSSGEPDGAEHVASGKRAYCHSLTYLDVNPLRRLLSVSRGELIPIPVNCHLSLLGRSAKIDHNPRIVSKLLTRMDTNAICR